MPAIARGLPNGITLFEVAGALATVADIGVAGADSWRGALADMTGAGEREADGPGAGSRGGRGVSDGKCIGAEVGAETRVSTEVASPTSCPRGIRGIGVTAGLDFRYAIQPVTLCKTTASANASYAVEVYGCARFTLGTAPNDWGVCSSPTACADRSREHATRSNALKR